MIRIVAIGLGSLLLFQAYTMIFDEETARTFGEDCGEYLVQEYGAGGILRGGECQNEYRSTLVFRGVVGFILLIVGLSIGKINRKNKE